MQLSVLHVIPWREASGSPYIISLFFEKLQGHVSAQVATLLILLIALSSLFALMLGYSRILYAAALDGNFFSAFAKLHPVKNFPHVSLLVLGGIAFVFSLLFKMREIITAIIVMRVLVQFVAQALGLIAYHRRSKLENFPYRMWLYPLPAVIAIIIWLFIFLYSGAKYFNIKSGGVLNHISYADAALGFIAVGIAVFFIKEQLKNKALAK
jgi:amino acid transporter